MKQIKALALIFATMLILSACRDRSQHIPEITYYGDDDVITNWITVSKPDYGRIWEPGTTHEIKWKANTEINSVNIDLYKKGQKLHTITEQIDNSGSFIWEIPEDITQTNHAQIRISKTNDGSIEGFSEVFYLIEN